MPKLSHHLCKQCYGELSYNWKAEARQEAGGSR